MTGLQREEEVKKGKEAAAWMIGWTMMLLPSAQQTD